MKQNAIFTDTEDRNTFLTSEQESIINRFLTKQMKRIMLLLLDNAMTNKEIAEQMGLTSNALSNILLRMKKCEIELLTMTKKEKHMLYSMTPIAQEYTEKYLVVRDKKDFTLIHINQSETAELISCRNALEQLKERLGISWSVEFPVCCISYYENDRKNAIPEGKAFFEAIENLIIKEQVKQFECVLNELEDELSRKLCLKYVSKFSHIRRLCVWDAEDWKTTYQFIDDIFCGDRICISLDCLEKSGTWTKDDIVNMAGGLSEIIECSKEKGMSKGEFIDTWSRYFLPHEKLIYYIAEKYGNKYC